MANAERIKAYKRGLSAEKACKLLLWLKGYRILATRRKTPVGEIDLIAKRFNHLHFIEVKARPSKTQCLEAVSLTQRARIEQAARYFIASSSRYAALDVHFDLMYSVPGTFPRHLVDAWQP